MHSIKSGASKLSGTCARYTAQSCMFLSAFSRLWGKNLFVRTAREDLRMLSDFARVSVMSRVGRVS